MCGLLLVAQCVMLLLLCCPDVCVVDRQRSMGKRAWCQLLADSRSTVGGHLQSPRCVCRRAVCLSIYPYDYPSPYLTIHYFGYLSIGVRFFFKCLLIYLFSCLCLCIYLSVCLFHVQTKSIGIETQRAQTN
jgi:hypothetical protein